MKPAEARALRLQREADARAVDERLLAHMRGESVAERVVPELIPRAEDEVRALGRVRRAAKAAEATPRDRRAKKLEELTEALRRLIYVQRVLSMDPLSRAALKPSELVALTYIDRSVLQAKMSDLTSRWVGTALPKEAAR